MSVAAISSTPALRSRRIQTLLCIIRRTADANRSDPSRGVSRLHGDAIYRTPCRLIDCCHMYACSMDYAWVVFVTRNPTAPRAIQHPSYWKLYNCRERSTRSVDGAGRVASLPIDRAIVDGDRYRSYEPTSRRANDLPNYR